MPFGKRKPKREPQQVKCDKGHIVGWNTTLPVPRCQTCDLIEREAYLRAHPQPVFCQYNHYICHSDHPKPYPICQRCMEKGRQIAEHRGFPRIEPPQPPRRALTHAEEQQTRLNQINENYNRNYGANGAYNRGSGTW